MDSARPSVSLLPGAVIGPYMLLAHIATGGMGQVWAARMGGAGGFSRLCALKVIRAGLALEPNYVAMFHDEANVAAAVHHPNVCEVFELVEQDGLLFMAMEWVRGESLQAMLAACPNNRIEPRIAARIVSDACAGLHAIHDATDETGAPLRAIHRDISPQNIMVTAEGWVKVTDLGIAKYSKQRHRTTQRGKIKGKISYVSPEQLVGDGYDQRSDLFSLGCVLYEATVGRKPFVGDSDIDTLREIALGRFEPPEAALAEYPEGLATIVTRALATDPDQRYATAREMHVALEDWLKTAGQVSSAEVADVVDRTVGRRIEARAETLRVASMTFKDVQSSRHPVALQASLSPSPPAVGVEESSDERELHEPTRELSNHLTVPAPPRRSVSPSEWPLRVDETRTIKSGVIARPASAGRRMWVGLVVVLLCSLAFYLASR